MYLSNMSEVEVFILIGMVAALLVAAVFIFSPSPEVSVDDPIDYSEFDDLNGEYLDFNDFEVARESLRNRFRVEGKSQRYFEVIDWLSDQFWIRWHVRKHYHALKKNTDNSLRKNDYGAVVQDRRFEEVTEFLRSVDFDPALMPLDSAVDEALKALDEFTVGYQSSGFDATSIPEDGFEFEGWVATNLKKFGWEAEATQGSGDQGLDVIASKNGCKVGIQCKLYSSNVGNKAVQEINAAKAHFNLDKGAVLTNAGYTKSARELAKTCDVLLLSHYDISRFDELFLDGKT